MKRPDLLKFDIMWLKVSELVVKLTCTLSVNPNRVAILPRNVTQLLCLRKLQTHSISQRAVTCLSTTCLSFTGSPSSSCRSPSPNREPRPIICLFLGHTCLTGYLTILKEAFKVTILLKERVTIFTKKLQCYGWAMLYFIRIFKSHACVFHFISITELRFFIS